jgi:hypothetical protein
MIIKASSVEPADDTSLEPRRLRLVIRAAGTPPRSYPLDATVVRLGSHPSCAVRIDEIEPHALTIERRAGRVRVHNRTDRPLTLGNGALPASASSDWPEGGRLELSLGLHVQLVADGSELASNLSSSERPGIEFEGRQAASQQAPATARATHHTSLGVVVPLLLVTVAVWLAGKSLSVSSPTPVPAGNDRFADLVKELRREGDRGRSVAHELQVAREDQERHRSDEARTRLLRVRDRILRHRRSDGRVESRLECFETALNWISRQFEEQDSSPSLRLSW